MIGTGKALFHGFGSGVQFDIPVDPNGPEAQRWLREELAKAPYQAARPTWFDRLSQSFFDWLASLTAPSGEGLSPWIPLLITLVVAAAVVVAFLIFGMPRLNRRARQPSDLFGHDDKRSAEDMREAARRAAASGDWNRAVEEMYRAIARGLEERTVLHPLPGTTAHALADRAAAAFPQEASRLTAAATVFDGVRYLGRNAGPAEFAAVSELEQDLRSAPVASLPPVGTVGTP